MASRALDRRPTKGIVMKTGTLFFASLLAAVACGVAAQGLSIPKQTETGPEVVALRQQVQELQLRLVNLERRVEVLSTARMQKVSP
jgi:hypothetical protein